MVLGGFSDLFWLLFVIYAGIAVCAYIPYKGAKPLDHSELFMPRMVLLSVLDFAGALFSVQGMIYAGSGLSSVAMSSLVLFAAFWPWILSGAGQTLHQLVALCGIVGGLSLAALAPKPGGEDATAEAAPESLQVLGVGMCLVSAAIYGLQFFLTQKFASERGQNQMAMLLGIHASAMTLSVIIARGQESLDLMTRSSLGVEGVAEHLALICVFQVIRQPMFLSILASHGGTVVGVVNAVQSVSET
eukprot:TRINITY_DN6090_c0_g1_i2.p1 TRINITY_DN6090_c0_g1~~TRINITY_DN6090_c0_g1_i2.p1  ORF type:complete len:269 (-),score=57.52 TRINITY_DN6090_c0_g1_i2:193-927(-)